MLPVEVIDLKSFVAAYEDMLIIGSNEVIIMIINRKNIIILVFLFVNILLRCNVGLNMLMILDDL